MPSQFRVAGYPPEHICQKFKDFAKEHNISESKALVRILAEYFGVTENVAQEVSYKYATLDQLQEIKEKVTKLSELYSDLKNELLSELSVELQRPKVENEKSKLSSILQGELLTASEPKPDKNNSELLPDSKVSLLAPMHGGTLSKRFGLNKNAVYKMNRNHQGNPEHFIRWSQAKDPDGLAWEYHEDDKLYHPVQSTQLEAGEGETVRVSQRCP